MFMEENKKPAIALTDQERFPLIHDLSMLKKLRQDEFAPAFNFKSGDRLHCEHLKKVQTYAHTIRTSTTFWDENTKPAWLDDYLQWCIQTVPFYRNRSKIFQEQPTIRRKDIGSVPWNFVSGEARLEDLLVYQTSGTTGPAMDVVFDPVSQACWIPQLESILGFYGISLDSRPDTVAIALICSQSTTITYASLSTYLNGAGILKVNLNSSEWSNPEHRTRYLEKYNPQILTGDPFAFMGLLELQPRITPKALVSSAMKLTDGIRSKLEAYFNCPVIDVYSLTECRMVAFVQGNRYRAIRPELYLEVFDKDKDILLPYGEQGELVITGGNNPFLPLIRYRTGDFCSLHMENGVPYLMNLEARNPVIFYTPSGKLVNNIDISRAMTNFPLAGFKLHQSVDYHLSFTGWTNEKTEREIVNTLEQIFGGNLIVKVKLEPISANDNFKTVTYSSDWN